MPMITPILLKNVAYNIQKEITAIGMIRTLSNMYEKHSATNKVYLIRKFVNTRMKKGYSIIVYIDNLNSILSHLLSMNINLMMRLKLYCHYPYFLGLSRSRNAFSNTTDFSMFTFMKTWDLIMGEDV